MQEKEIDAGKDESAGQDIALAIPWRRRRS